MAFETPSLGKLAQLPAEASLSILWASYQLYDEVLPSLWRNEVLRLRVSPRYQYRSWITISNELGAEWHLCSLDDAISRGFCLLPCEKLDGIIVEIEAPDSEDPGQMVCLWKKVCDLVELLEPVVTGLASFEVVLQDANAARWSSEGTFQQSRSDDPDRFNGDHIADYDDDCEVILTPFCHLGNIQKASVRTTEIEGWEDIDHFFANMEKAMQQREPFGTVLDGPWRSDNVVQSRQDTYTLQLDDALDNLKGDTAMMMRLDRFSLWYTGNGFQGESKYVNKLE